MPTLYVMKLVGLPVIMDIVDGYFTTNDNSAIYDTIALHLGPDVLYNSTVLEVERSSNNTTGIRMIVSTPSGIVLVESQKLIVSVQPTLENLKPLDLTLEEKQLFGQFEYTQYFTGAIINTGIPANISISAYDPTKPYNVPSVPHIYLIDESALEGVHLVWYATTDPLVSDEAISSAILESVNGLQIEGKENSNAEFVKSSNHKPFVMHVSSEAIEGGFYTALNALQGKKNTWYISATFQSHDSSLIWEFAETLLPQIAAA